MSSLPSRLVADVFYPISALTENARNPETRSKAVDFFKKEYECDRYIAHMKKPIVTFMDGTTSTSCCKRH
jgi:enoyl-CoA hydratase/carnithine racemase